MEEEEVNRDELSKRQIAKTKVRQGAIWVQGKPGWYVLRVTVLCRSRQIGEGKVVSRQ